MALLHGAAAAPTGFNDWFDSALAPRMEGHSLYNRQSNSTNSGTINMFIDSTNSRFEYAASIVEANSCQTIFALQCTDAPSYVGTQTCGPNAPKITLTSGASLYAFSSAISTRTLGQDVTVTVQETCKLAATTAATCTATLKATASSTSTSTVTTSTASGIDYYRFDVAITGGAEKTASATGSCQSKTSAATSVSSKKMAMLALAGAVVAGIQIML